MSHLLPSPLRSALVLCGLAFALVAARGENAPVTRDYSFLDSTADVFPKYRTLADAKDYNGAVALLTAQLAKVPADSYDAAMLNQIIGQTYIQKGDYSASIGPLEKGLALSDSKTPTYFDERPTRDLVYFLASLYLQEAVQIKDQKLSAAYYAKADKAMARWLTLTKKTTPDAQLIYAQILYNWAVQDPDHVNEDLIKRALEQVDVGLHLSTHPKDTLYIFKMACLQQLGKIEELGEVLELIVKIKPDSGNYWQQLASCYLQEEKPLRAAITFERAQANGQLIAPKDYYNLVGIYFNLGQYGKAAELLANDLRSGKIENDIKNWELLSSAYQQLDRPYKQIDALKEATKAFPQSGQLEFLIAQTYNAMEKPAEALPHLQAAVAKGNLAKPHVAYLLLAYVGYQLKKYDVALEAAKHAAEYPEGAKDGKNMMKAIDDIMKEREAKKNKV